MTRGHNLTGAARLSCLMIALVGAGAGFINGLLGAAGGIVLVTLLPYMTLPERLLRPGRWSDGPEVGFRHLSDRRDLLTLALTVMLPVSALSFRRYLAGGVNLPPTLPTSLILPAAAGGLLGAWLLDRLPQKRLRQLFALLIVVSGLRMLF